LKIKGDWDEKNLNQIIFEIFISNGNFSDSSELNIAFDSKPPKKNISDIVK
jgi:hypothetical protein